MEHDYLYFWDKLGSSGTRQLLGEVKIGKEGFNMSFVIDGTKDSTKIVVWSFSISQSIKPNTIVWHENTGTWWCVLKDKVDRIVNEQGWLYIHNLQLEGAIELFNARDLTDCGFNQNTYTIYSFVNRLISLSSVEIPVYFVTDNNLDTTKNIDYIKTFENYTLLSALREFFNGYNCSIKLNFYQSSSDSHYIQYANLYVVPKTGNITRPIKTIDQAFNEIKEIKTINKNSYGTTVVSNAENVVSTKAKLYPSVGYTRISGENYLIQPSDALIRLPSKVNSVEYVDMVKGKISVTIGVNKTGDYGGYSQNTIVGSTTFDIANVTSFNNAIDWIKNTLLSQGPAAIWVQNNTDDQFWADAKGQASLDTLSQYFSFRLYDIKHYDPLANTFFNDNEIYQFTRAPSGNKPFVLGEKTLRNGVREPNEVMYWERGSNVIKGFDFFSYHGISNVITSSSNEGVYFIRFTQTHPTGTWHYNIVFGDYKSDTDVAGYVIPSKVTLSLLNTYYKVKYIPMGDIKIKYDNQNDGNDIQLYNQNGRFVDGVALSKLLVSYKDEITSDNITRYCIGYSLSEMPQVGDIIINNNDKYVINNVSIDFYMTENGTTFGYYLVGEYTLSKNVATKSLMTSPNTNIRDYGIPQNYNVKRKQLYRDFYELSFSNDSNSDSDIYMPLSSILNITNVPQNYVSHVGIMKLTYKQPFGGGGQTYEGGTVPPSDTWYYQLESTIYYMKKAMYEIIDFQDNNIIGYDCQNVTCGFDIRRLFEVIVVGNANIDIINTPISFVDDDGQMQGIDICMCSTSQLMSIYDQYKATKEQELGRTYDITLYNRCVFIPSDVYNLALNNNDFMISEQNYNKDALEVPVFEYSCQLDDSENVVIGENVFESFESDFAYLYELVILPRGFTDDKTWKQYIILKQISKIGQELTIDDTNETLRKACRFYATESLLQLYAYDKISVNTQTLNATRTNLIRTLNFVTNGASIIGGDVDVAIVRYTIPKNYSLVDNIVQNVSADLMFVVKNATNSPYNIGGAMRLFINHYKLK